MLGKTGIPVLKAAFYCKNIPLNSISSRRSFFTRSIDFTRLLEYSGLGRRRSFLSALTSELVLLWARSRSRSILKNASVSALCFDRAHFCVVLINPFRNFWSKILQLQVLFKFIEVKKRARSILKLASVSASALEFLKNRWAWSRSERGPTLRILWTALCVLVL
jgi:hypothetical protein